MNHIESMDSIYASAFLFITVTDGDMHAGIQGMTQQRLI